MCLPAVDRGRLPVSSVRDAESHGFIDQFGEVGRRIAFAKLGDDLLEVVPHAPLRSAGVLEKVGQQARPVVRLGSDVKLLEAIEEPSVLVEARLGSQDEIDCLVPNARAVRRPSPLWRKPRPA